MNLSVNSFGRVLRLFWPLFAPNLWGHMNPYYPKDLEQKSAQKNPKIAKKNLRIGSLIQPFHCALCCRDKNNKSQYHNHDEIMENEGPYIAHQKYGLQE